MTDKPPTLVPHTWRSFVRRNFLSGPLRQTLPSGAAVLDIGCGWGAYFQLNPAATGVDLDSPCIEHLLACGYRVVRADITQPLPFKAQSFAWVILHDVLEHFSLECAGSILREAHRVLIEGGGTVVLVPNRAGYDYGLRINAGHVHFITPDEIISTTTGLLSIERCYAYPLPRWLGQYFVHNKEVLVLRKRGIDR